MTRPYGPPEDREVLESDCTLTRRGAQAARHVSSVLDEQGKKAARKVARQSYGWKNLGYGVARHVYETSSIGVDEQVAFELSNNLDDAIDPFMDGSHDCVLKVSTANHGQTAMEVAQWEHITGRKYHDQILDPPGEDGKWSDLRPYLAPISDYDDGEYRWMVMRKLDTEPPPGEPQVGDSLARQIQQQTGWVAGDLHDDNIAYHNGDAYVIDYGHQFSWSGWTTAERIEQFEDALDHIGCRDVYWRRIGRKESVTEFGHPLDLPGKPYGQRSSRVRTTRGGRATQIELYGTIIPSNGTTRVEAEEALAEALDTPAKLRSIRANVKNKGDGWVPEVKASYNTGYGPTLSNIQHFITVFFDRYDTAFAPHADEFIQARTPDPPEVDDEQMILDDIREEMERFEEEMF